jgi:hypothetical protein
MLSLKSALEKRHAKAPVNVRPLAHSLGVSTCRALIAAINIAEFQRHLGGALSPVGSPVGPVQRQPNGTFIQAFETGIVRDKGDSQDFGTTLQAEVQCAAIKSFGTDDHDGTDEAYAIVSVYTINGSSQGDASVSTQLIDSGGNVKAIEGSNIFGKSVTVASSVNVPGDGIRIHIAVFDAESGNKQEIVNKVANAVRSAVNNATAAVQSAASSNPEPLDGVLGSVLSSDLLNDVTLGLSGLIASLFADDFIGQHVYSVSTKTLLGLSTADGVQASLLPPGTDNLPRDVQANVPPLSEVDAQGTVITNGAGTYKAYFLTKTRLVPAFPVT